MCFGQNWYHLPNYQFNDWSNTHCPWDTNLSYPQVDHWIAYQTLNDQWDGPVDSSICIPTWDPSAGIGARVNLESIDPNRALFFRMQVDSPGLELKPDWIYQLFFHMSINGASLNQADTCNGPCSSLNIGMLIPDSSGTSSVLRWYEYPSSLSPWLGINRYCQITEGFSTLNGLKEFYFKLRFDNVSAGDKWGLYECDFYEGQFFWEPCLIDSILADYYDSQIDHYRVRGYDLSSQCASSFSNNILVHYNASGYPSPSNKSYVPVRPHPNSSSVDTIDIIIDQNNTFNFQPFTELIGDTIIGDTLRHVVNLVNDGSIMCVPDIVELTFGGGTNYIHQGGGFELQGRRSCVQLAKDGKLILGEGSTLHYGSNGLGMLLYRPRGSIELRSGSTLHFEGTFILQEPKHSTQRGEVFIRLPKTTSLIFEPGARIRNELSIDQAMKLNVLMEGGTIDLSGLSAEDREKVRLIYPDKHEERDPILSVWPNPASSFVNVVWTAPADDEVTVQWFSAAGRLVGSETFYAEKGLQTAQLKVPNRAEGLYHVRLITHRKAYSRTVYCVPAR